MVRMHLFSLVVPMVCLGVALGQTCENGLPGVSKGLDYCCKAECGECGGANCSDRGAGTTADDCCTSTIKDNGVKCADTNVAPCLGDVAVVVSGFVCAGDAGVASGDVCCAASCESCGGSGCSGRAGGAASCCTKEIVAADVKCSKTGVAPCLVDDEVVETKPVAPSSGFACSGGVGIQNNNVCCASDCGTCADDNGCGARGAGGANSCCPGSITAAGLPCSKMEAGPCIMDLETVEAEPAYEEVGCFTDKISPDRIMTNSTDNKKGMTLEVCQKHCVGSLYFGVQYGIECWCDTAKGDVNYPFAVHGPSTSCNVPCSGEADQVCGGEFAMSVYRNL